MKKQVSPKTILVGLGVAILLFAAAGVGVLVQLSMSRKSQPTPETTQPAEVSSAAELLQAGRVDESVTYMQSEVQKSTVPDDTKYLLYTQLGSVYYEKGDYMKAIEAYHGAASIKETAAVMQSIGSMWMHLDNKPQAVEYYRKAIPLLENSPTRDEDVQVVEMLIKGLEES